MNSEENCRPHGRSVLVQATAQRTDEHMESLLVTSAMTQRILERYRDTEMPGWGLGGGIQGRPRGGGL